jgi:hypothetical protein
MGGQAGGNGAADSAACAGDQGMAAIEVEQ